MKRARIVLLSAFVALSLSATLLAHEETYKGTVVTVTVKTIDVKVIDDASKKESTMAFDITAKTKVMRGDKVVKLADAHIQKDERVAVTVNHDLPGHAATVIRLAVAK